MLITIDIEIDSSDGWTAMPTTSSPRTENATSIAYMLHNCESLTEAPDFSGFDTPNATSVAYMLSNSSGLTRLQKL